MTPVDREGSPIPEVLMPTGLRRLYRRPWNARQIAKHFNRVYYAHPERTMVDCAWLGTPIIKYPTDLWIYQEIVAEYRPQLIIETGTYEGGSGAVPRLDLRPRRGGQGDHHRHPRPQPSRDPAARPPDRRGHQCQRASCAPRARPGPHEAVEAFLASDPRFARDEHSERLLVTANPGGFLRRVDPSSLRAR